MHHLCLEVCGLHCAGAYKVNPILTRLLGGDAGSRFDGWLLTVSSQVSGPLSLCEVLRYGVIKSWCSGFSGRPAPTWLGCCDSLYMEMGNGYSTHANVTCADRADHADDAQCNGEDGLDSCATTRCGDCDHVTLVYEDAHLPLRSAQIHSGELELPLDILGDSLPSIPVAPAASDAWNRKILGTPDLL